MLRLVGLVIFLLIVDELELVTGVRLATTVKYNGTHARRVFACSRLYLLVVEHAASAWVDWDEFEQLVLDAAHRLEGLIRQVEARHQFSRLLEQLDCHL